ncbi:MAG: hypothetical protein PVH87_26110, partial [Desulfobacteraceae bacterium]
MAPINRIAGFFVLMIALGGGCAGMARSQILRIVDSSTDPMTLHPHRSFDPNSDLIISQMYEGLIDFDAEGRLIPR